MKHNGHMRRANAPGGGNRRRKTSQKGLRNKHWREHPIIEPRSYPPKIIGWRSEPLIVIHPVRATKTQKRLEELQVMALVHPTEFFKNLAAKAAGAFSKFDRKRVVPNVAIPRRSAA